MAASRKQVEELQRAHDQKIKEQKIIDEKRKLMESQQTKVCNVCLRILEKKGLSPDLKFCTGIRIT